MCVYVSYIHTYIPFTRIYSNCAANILSAHTYHTHNSIILSNIIENIDICVAFMIIILKLLSDPCIIHGVEYKTIPKICSIAYVAVIILHLIYIMTCSLLEPRIAVCVILILYTPVSL